MAIIDKIRSLISGSSTDYMLKDNSGTKSSHSHDIANVDGLQAALDSKVDTKVTSVGNHYTPAEDSSAQLSASASGATAAWSIDVVKGVTLKRDAKGHVTGVAVTSGKIPANPNTDTKVTSVGNHYTPAEDSSAQLSASASGATAAWSIDVVKGVTLKRDAKGHVTGVAVTSGKIPANPNTDTKAAQNSTTTAGEFPMLLKYNANTTNETNTVKYVSGVTVNPSTKKITATGFVGALTGNVTGNCSGSSGSCTGNAATATRAGNINSSSNLGGDANASGSTYTYFLLASWTYKGASDRAWKNVADVFSISSRHNGAGILVVSAGVNTGSPSGLGDMVCELDYIGSRNHGSSRRSDEFYIYGKYDSATITWTAYLIVQQHDSSYTRICSRLARAQGGVFEVLSTPTNLGTSIPSSYGTLVASVCCNWAERDSAGNIITSTYARDSDVVHKSGAETITTRKTISTTQNQIGLTVKDTSDSRIKAEDPSNSNRYIQLDVERDTSGTNVAVYGRNGQSKNGSYIVSIDSSTVNSGDRGVCCLGQNTDLIVQLGKYKLDFSGTLGTTSDTIYFT